MDNSARALVVVGILLAGVAGCGGGSPGPVGHDGQGGGAAGRGGTAGGAAGRGGAAGTGTAGAGTAGSGGGTPCFAPSDCAGDATLSCCVDFVAGGGTVSCRPTATCLGEGGYVACVTPEDCPASQPCVFLTEVMGRPFSICGGASSP